MTEETKQAIERLKLYVRQYKSAGIIIDSRDDILSVCAAIEAADTAKQTAQAEALEALVKELHQMEMEERGSVNAHGIAMAARLAKNKASSLRQGQPLERTVPQIGGCTGHSKLITSEQAQQISRSYEHRQHHANG